MKQVRGALLSVLLLALFGSTPFAQQEDAVTQRARKIHFSSIVLDTHIDVTPNLQREGWKFEEEHQAGAVDLPRMKKGGLNGLFFSIFMSGRVTGPKAVNDAVERIAAVHKLAADLPDKVMLCTTAADVRRAHREGERVVRRRADRAARGPVISCREDRQDSGRTPRDENVVEERIATGPTPGVVDDVRAT